MGSFAIALTGLNASQDALQSVSNNLANLDTVGYKDQNTSFQTIFAQSSLLNGVGDPLQTGLGANASQTLSNFSDGTQSATGIASNMALSGNGFFITRSASGAIDYSRAGDFTTNTSGQLVTPSGNLVLGYPAVNGVISSQAPLQPIQINSGASLPATATTQVSMDVNLSAGAAIGATFSSTTPVYDSLGTAQQLTINYTKTGTNTWSYTATLPGASNPQVGQGTLNFNASGALTSPTGSIPLSAPALTDGAASLNISWNLNDSSGNPTLTQTAAASSTASTTQNGSAAGTLSSYSVLSNGTIEGTFTNGLTNALGQVALANFNNDQGLQQVSGNEFAATAASGSAQVGIAGSLGLGTITGGSVESSNVDVATEFGKMIVAQQAYQANAKTITTQDQILQTTIEMITS
jgi:flagellar hook protein FlgE